MWTYAIILPIKIHFESDLTNNIHTYYMRGFRSKAQQY